MHLLCFCGGFAVCVLCVCSLVLYMALERLYFLCGSYLQPVCFSCKCIVVLLCLFCVFAVVLLCVLCVCSVVLYMALESLYFVCGSYLRVVSFL